MLFSGSPNVQVPDDTKGQPLFLIVRPRGRRPVAVQGSSARQKIGQAPQCGAFRQVPPAKTTVVGASGAPEGLNNNMDECPTGQTSEIRRGFRAFWWSAPPSAPPARLLPSFLRGRSAQTPPEADLHRAKGEGRHFWLGGVPAGTVPSSHCGLPPTIARALVE